MAYLAEQLDITDSGCLSDYSTRNKTRLEHAWEIQRECGFEDFAAQEEQLRGWLQAQVWTTTDGPKTLVAWMRRRAVLLPGVTVLVRLVSQVREEVTDRLWEALCALIAPAQRANLEALLVVPAGERYSNLDRLRRGPTRRSGQEMVHALDRVSEIFGLGLGEVDLPVFPPRRTTEMARYGLAGKAPLLRRHGNERRLATLLATVVHLQARSIDDALELLDLLMTTKLLAQAERESAKEQVKRLPKMSAESAKLASAVTVLFETIPGPEELGDAAAVNLAQVWERIEQVVPRTELAAALRALEEMLPAPGSDEDEQWRAELVTRYGSVRGFLPMLTEGIVFGATVEGALVLEAMRRLPDLIGRRKIHAREVDIDLIKGQAGNALARAWGGGRAASVGGMRFVVPTNTIHARPNRRHFGRRKGSTWLNMVNDQAVGLSSMVVAGTPRDTLHLLDVLYNQDGGLAPDIIITDEGSFPGSRHFRETCRLATRTRKSPRRSAGGGVIMLRPHRGLRRHIL